MDYTVITPLEKAIPQVVTTTASRGLPWGWIAIALLAAAILGALAMHEYEKARHKNQQELA